VKLGLDSTSLPELLFLKFLPSTYTVTAISWRLPLISQLFFTLAILKKASPFLKVGCMFLSRLSLCALIFGHTYSHNLLLCLKSRPERHSNKSMLEVLMIYHVMLDSNCSTLYLLTQSGQKLLTENNYSIPWSIHPSQAGQWLGHFSNADQSWNVASPLFQLPFFHLLLPCIIFHRVIDIIVFSQSCPQLLQVMWSWFYLLLPIITIEGKSPC